MNTDISYKVFHCFSASNMSPLCNMQKQYPFWSSLAQRSVAHYRSIMFQSDIRELPRRRMRTNRLVNIWIHCVKMLQSLASLFTTVHRPCISWRLWVSEPHGYFVYLSTFVLHSFVYQFSAVSVSNMKSIQGGICCFPESHKDLFHILMYWDCKSN